MHQGESNFWDQYLRDSAPGWEIHVDRNWQTHGVGISRLKMNIYAYDTFSGWHAGCATSEDDMHGAAQDIAALDPDSPMRSQINATCSSRIKDAADQRVGADHPDTKQALILSMVAMTTTRTYQIVLEKLGGTGGHWLTLLYRLKDNSIVTRPVYRQGCGALLSPSDLQQWANEVVQIDLASTQSTVYQILHAGGGLLLPMSTDESAYQGLHHPATTQNRNLNLSP